MTPVEVAYWKRAADDLQIEIVAPFQVDLPDIDVFLVSALVKNFGPKLGMLVDADWNVLSPHKDAIIDAGYGFSCCAGSPEEYEQATMIEVLQDWGWSGAPDRKPDWLGNLTP